MIPLLQEGFSVLQGSKKVSDYHVTLFKEDSTYVFLMGPERTTERVELITDYKDDSFFQRVGLSELNYRLTNYSILLNNQEMDLKIATYPTNKVFTFKQMRCKHIRIKEPYKGKTCNKFLVGAFAEGLGAQVVCPRCRNISYI